MEAISLQQLETLKYSELQRLAKSAGVKANLKADKLLKTLKQHFYEITQENGSTVNKRDSSSSNTKKLDGNQVSLNVTFITQRHRKRMGDDDDHQGNAKEKAVHENNPEFSPRKEIFCELKGSEDPQDAGSEKTLDQPEHLTSSGVAKNVVPSQCEGRISTKCGKVAGKTLVDPVSGKKPRYTTNQSKSGRTGFASTTPNFKKMHEAQFKKMLSIDDYVERKTKMIKNFSNSVNEVKMLAKKSNYLKTSQKETPNSNSKTCSSFKEFLLSPHPRGKNCVATCTPSSLRCSPRHSVNGNKSILTRKSEFSSTTLSTIKMNVRFSEATKDNEHKRSLIKTPSRKSPFLNTCTPDSQKTSTSVSRKDFGRSTTKCHLRESSNSAVVLKLEVSTGEPTSTKKPTFDLKASLSKPLSYQPHKGKLKPWGKSKENIQSVCSHKKDYKQPVPTTREERRERHEEGRKLRKDKALGIRRGLTLA